MHVWNTSIGYLVPQTEGDIDSVHAQAKAKRWQTVEHSEVNRRGVLCPFLGFRPKSTKRGSFPLLGQNTDSWMLPMQTAKQHFCKVFQSWTSDIKEDATISRGWGSGYESPAAIFAPMKLVAMFCEPNYIHELYSFPSTYFMSIPCENTLIFCNCPSFSF